jgi:hypothetical protein
MRGAERTQRRSGLLSGIIIAPIIGVFLIKTGSSPQTLSTQQLETIPVSGNNPTGWRSSPQAFEAKLATRPPSDPCWSSEKDDMAEIDQELSAKSAKWPGATGSALWFHSLTG